MSKQSGLTALGGGALAMLDGIAGCGLPLALVAGVYATTDGFALAVTDGLPLAMGDAGAVDGTGAGHCAPGKI